MMPIAMFGRSKRFPEKLWECVTDKSSDLFLWRRDGAAFIVNEERFKDEVMTSYPGFMQTNTFMNFRRQLREYGFEWRTDAKGLYEFSHPSFLKDRRAILFEVTTKRKSRQAIINEDILDDFTATQYAKFRKKLEQNWQKNKVADPDEGFNTYDYVPSTDNVLSEQSIQAPSTVNIEESDFAQKEGKKRSFTFVKIPREDSAPADQPRAKHAKRRPEEAKRFYLTDRTLGSYDSMPVTDKENVCVLPPRTAGQYSDSEGVGGFLAVPESQPVLPCMPVLPVMYPAPPYWMGGTPPQGGAFAAAPYPNAMYSSEQFKRTIQYMNAMVTQTLPPKLETDNQAAVSTPQFPVCPPAMPWFSPPPVKSTPAEQPHAPTTTTTGLHAGVPFSPERLARLITHPGAAAADKADPGLMAPPILATPDKQQPLDMSVSPARTSMRSFPVDNLMTPPYLPLNPDPGYPTAAQHNKTPKQNRFIYKPTSKPGSEKHKKNPRRKMKPVNIEEETDAAVQSILAIANQTFDSPQQNALLTPPYPSPVSKPHPQDTSNRHQPVPEPSLGGPQPVPQGAVDKPQPVPDGSNDKTKPQEPANRQNVEPEIHNGRANNETPLDGRLAATNQYPLKQPHPKTLPPSIQTKINRDIFRLKQIISNERKVEPITIYINEENENKPDEDKTEEEPITIYIEDSPSPDVDGAETVVQETEQESKTGGDGTIDKETEEEAKPCEDAGGAEMLVDDAVKAEDADAESVEEFPVFTHSASPSSSDTEPHVVPITPVEAKLSTLGMDALPGTTQGAEDQVPDCAQEYQVDTSGSGHSRHTKTCPSIPHAPVIVQQIPSDPIQGYPLCIQAIEADSVITSSLEHPVLTIQPSFQNPSAAIQVNDNSLQAMSEAIQGNSNSLQDISEVIQGNSNSFQDMSEAIHIAPAVQETPTVIPDNSLVDSSSLQDITIAIQDRSGLSNDISSDIQVNPGSLDNSSAATQINCVSFQNVFLTSQDNSNQDLPATMIQFDVTKTSEVRPGDSNAGDNTNEAM